MTYLIDTNVVSELRKAKTDKADRHVKAWANEIPTASMYLSTICVLELERGTLLMERRDTSQGAMLRFWLESHVLPAFSGRTLPVDIRVARRCAVLQIPNPRPYRDALIAATALVHKMILVTRNVSDFTHTGVALLNPWEPQRIA